MERDDPQCFIAPRGIIWMRAWRTLYPRRILHAPGAIKMFRQVRLKPGPSSPELNALQLGHRSPQNYWKI